MAEIINRPTKYKFRNVNGHSAKVVTEGETCTLEIECDGDGTPMMRQNETEFTYFVTSSDGGYFILKNKFVRVEAGNTIRIPAGEEFSFGGYLRTRLTHKAPFMPEHEAIRPRPANLRRPIYEANGSLTTPEPAPNAGLRR